METQTPVAKKKSGWASTVTAALMLILAASAGIANWRDTGIQNYYNDFYRLAYRDVFTSWNTLVDVVKKDGVKDQEISDSAKKFLNGVKSWTKKMDGTEVPEFATNAHAVLVKTLKTLETEGGTLMKHIEETNVEEFGNTLRRMTQIIHTAEKDLAAFKDRMAKERNFAFHDAEEDK